MKSRFHLDWELVTNLASMVIVLMALIAWLTLPFAHDMSNISQTGLIMLLANLAQNLPAAIIMLLLIIIPLVMTFLNGVVRLLNVDLRTIRGTNSPITPLLALLRLGESDLRRETRRLAILLAAVQMIGLIAYALVTLRPLQEGFAMLFFGATIPLLLLSLTHLDPIQRWVIPKPQSPFHVYIDILEGSLKGGRPRLELSEVSGTFQENALPAGLLYIGTDEKLCHLTLYNDYMALPCHACLFRADAGITLRLYGGAYLDQRWLDQPGDYILRDGTLFQIGQNLFALRVQPTYSNI